MNNPYRKSRIANAASLVFLLYLLCSLKAAADDFFSKDYRVGEAPVAVAVGDFNGDGKPDVAVANANSGDVSVLLGRGDGTFSTATSFTVGVSHHSIAVGDFNGDHRLDIVIGSVDVLGSLTPVKASLLLGHGDGTFQSAVQLNIEQLTRSFGRRNDLQENAAPYYSD